MCAWLAVTVFIVFIVFIVGVLSRSIDFGSVLINKYARQGRQGWATPDETQIGPRGRAMSAQGGAAQPWSPGGAWQFGKSAPIGAR